MDAEGHEGILRVEEATGSSSLKRKRRTVYDGEGNEVEERRGRGEEEEEDEDEGGEEGFDDDDEEEEDNDDDDEVGEEGDQNENGEGELENDQLMMKILNLSVVPSSIPPIENDEEEGEAVPSIYPRQHLLPWISANGEFDEKCVVFLLLSPHLLFLPFVVIPPALFLS